MRESQSNFKFAKINYFFLVLLKAKYLVHLDVFKNYVINFYVNELTYDKKVRLSTLHLYHLCVEQYFKQNSFLELLLQIKANNVFCDFTEKKNNRIVFSIGKSSGHYKIKLIKKNYRYHLDLILKKFFKDVRTIYFKEIFTRQELLEEKRLLVISLSLPYHVRSGIVENLLAIFAKRQFRIVININEKAIFNGCRAKKKRRLKKRRKGLRFYK